MTVLRIVFWILAVGGLIRLCVAVTTRVLKVHRRADQVHFATTGDGWSLALHRYLPAEPRFSEPVVLCHGLGANRFNFDLVEERSLARSLAGRGFDVWSLELRGTGMSSRPGLFSPFSWAFDFDDHLDLDIPAALELVLRVSGSQKIFWVGHSMGGMLGYAHAGCPEREDLAGLVAVSSPVWLDQSVGLRRLSPIVRLATLFGAVLFRPLARFFAPVLGWAPAFLIRPFIFPGGMEPKVIRRALVNLVESVSSTMVRQFIGWMRDRKFCSADGERDYLKRLDGVDIPVLLIAAEQDLLASPKSIEPAYERIRTKDKQMRVFGSDAGDDFDFGHGDVLLGRLAPDVVHVEIADWLEQRASSLDGASGPAQVIHDDERDEP